MLDQNFCNKLEYIICDALENTWDELTKGFWCDGCELTAPDNYYSKKYINDNRQTYLRAYVGKDGQDDYNVIFKFGKKALSKYARDLDVFDCIPKSQFENWFNIDTVKKNIEIQLE
ncbi:hypothetical protein [Ferruginibacter sp. SUN106]|uniref:hypothetical protein n=1 Tax=Ferruginibacter sp. SUN106 TaxID=2978348 RepID=UPI003D36E59D